MLPTGSTALEPGDLLVVAGPRRGGDTVAAITRWARGEGETADTV